MILMRGPCDILAISKYLKPSPDLIVQSAFKGELLDTVWDSSISLYLAQAALKKKIISPFVEPSFYPDDDIFTDKYNAIVISIIGDGILGVYENKMNKQRIAYGLWPFDATNKSGSIYFNKDVMHGGIPSISKEQYASFGKEYEYLGQAKPKDVVENIRLFLNEIPSSTKVIILLGQEHDNKYGEKNPALINNGADYYRSLNAEMVSSFNCFDNVILINPTDYYKRPIHKYKIFFYGFETINHYSIKTYYLLAKRISEITNKKLTINRAFYVKQFFRRDYIFIKMCIRTVIKHFLGRI